jgi:MFS family permease
MSAVSSLSNGRGVPEGRPAFFLPAILLGFATIGAYGVAYYAIGVLIPQIAAETGWGSGTLSGGFAIGVLASGGVALTSGRVFDRRGSRFVVAPGLAVGAAAFVLASWAETPWQFLVAWAVGGAAVAGTLYYNVTMPIVSRLYPAQRASALSVLTLLGALASPIFYPLTGWMTEEWGWRGALRGLVVVMLLCAGPAALLVRAPAARVVDGAPRADLREALRDPAVSRALLMLAVAAIGSSALLLHQVAAMQAAGLSLALASGVAGARGAFQIPGRLLLTPLVSRLGLSGTMAVCYGAAATSSLALLFAQGTPWATPLALYFAAVGGMSLGLLSPLHGLFQAELYGDRYLGTLTGVSTVIGGLAQALGAWLAGVAADRAGGYVLPLAMVVALQVCGILILAWQQRAFRARVAEVAAPA